METEVSGGLDKNVVFTTILPVKDRWFERLQIDQESEKGLNRIFRGSAESARLQHQQLRGYVPVHSLESSRCF